MLTALRLLLGLVAACACACPEPEMGQIEGRRLSAGVVDTPGETLIHARPGGELLVKIEWLLGAEPAPVFARHGEAAAHQLVSRVRVGSTTITRTILSSPAEGVILIHLLADMPGALSFHASLAPPVETPVRVIDRRQLHWQRPADQALEEVRLWVLPFESEVEPGPAGILLRGEGEALLILDFGSGLPEDTPEVLGRKHAPGQIPADPSRIWRGISAAGR